LQVTAVRRAGASRWPDTLVPEARKCGKVSASAVIVPVELNNHAAAAAAAADHAAHGGLPDDLMARVAPCLARRETRLTCCDMVNGLLSELDDYNCWTLAEAARHADPCRMQRLLSRACCDDQAMLGSAADWAVEQLNEGQGGTTAVTAELTRRRGEAAVKPGRRFRSFPGKDHFGIAGPVPEKALGRSRPQQPPHLGGECFDTVTE
jgi:hypothetical protein